MTAALAFVPLVGGNLNNGSNAGVGCVNSNNALGNTNWNIGGRYSGEFLEQLPGHVHRP